ncbi:MAG: hypothetical protein RJA81_518 [Planctomycetota bacterium]
MKSIGILVGLSIIVAFSAESKAQIQLLRDIQVPGTAKDLSGDKGFLDDNTPADQLGGPSGLEWTGRGQVYLWLSDRGPKDGATTHTPRYHEVDLTLSLVEGAQPVIRRTVKLFDTNGKPLTGRSTAFQAGKPEDSPRFDSEGIAIWEGKTVISEEYGPVIRIFDNQGKAISDFPVPDHFKVQKPSGDEDEELAQNNRGRQPNAGFEGLCTDGNGGLMAIVQRPLLQDGAMSADGKRIGRNVRILSMCGPNCKPREYVYPLDNAKQGISEICHVGGSVFLTIERDGKEMQSKKIMMIDISDATDVSAVASLPSDSLPDEIKAVKKRLLIDLQDPKFGLAGKNFPEKIEGLAFGPDLKDGRRLLVVATDNDFEADEATRIWFFAIDASALKP